MLVEVDVLVEEVLLEVVGRGLVVVGAAEPPDVEQAPRTKRATKKVAPKRGVWLADFTAAHRRSRYQQIRRSCCRDGW